MNSNLKMPTLGASFIPIIVLMILLAFNVVFFGSDSSYGPNQIALLVAASIAGVIGLRFGRTYEHFYNGVIDGIQSAMGAVIILLLIGALAGTWLISGVVPAMIYYGLEILNPTIFLVASCVICAIVSLATGSSWSTIATVGIALVAIGQILEIPIGWSAGAIISGAYFGDKMSPLSDTTNLAPAIAGTDLITHIRHMLWTTVPSISIALIVFLIVGFTQTGEGDADKVLALQEIISTKFNINGWLFLVPIAVIFLIIKKVPTIPALFLGSIIGGLFAVIFQPEIIKTIGGESLNYASASYKAILHSMALDSTEFFSAENDAINDLFMVDEGNRSSLLKAGGMVGMMNTVWLVICALTFGGAMQAGGFLKRITRAILSVVNSTGSLIASTAGTCLFFNITASDQYIAIVVPGKMFKDSYKERGLAPENLSRALEDSGTVTSVLIPWNTCGVAQSGVLGVATGTYWIYCIFNLVSPVMTILFGILDIKINKLKEVEKV